MSIKSVTAIVFFACVLSGCGSDDSIKLEDGRRVKIPTNVNLDQWAAETVSYKDAQLVLRACRDEFQRGHELSERVEMLCHRADWMDMKRWKE